MRSLPYWLLDDTNGGTAEFNPKTAEAVSPETALLGASW